MSNRVYPVTGMHITKIKLNNEKHEYRLFFDRYHGTEHVPDEYAVYASSVNNKWHAANRIINKICEIWDVYRSAITITYADGWDKEEEPEQQEEAPVVKSYYLSFAFQGYHVKVIESFGTFERALRAALDIQQHINDQTFLESQVVCIDNDGINVFVVGQDGTVTL